MKYDCNKTKDYIYNVLRMCHYYEGGCEGCKKWVSICPFGLEELYNKHLFSNVMNEKIMQDEVVERLIKDVQTWSDNHQEEIRLTEREIEFIKTIRNTNGLQITKNDKDEVWVSNKQFGQIILLEDGMFDFLPKGESINLSILNIFWR